MVPKLYGRALEAPKGSFFLFGPRGSGKSTWVRGLGRAGHTVDLLDEALYQEMLADPGVFARRLEGLRRGLRAIGELGGVERRLLVHPETERSKTRDGIEVVPALDLAEMLASGALA